MKVRNPFSRSFTSGPAARAAAEPQLKKVNVAAFAQWSASRVSSDRGLGGGNGKGRQDSSISKAKASSKDKVNKSRARADNAHAYNPGPAYRTRATAETAFSDSCCFSHDYSLRRNSMGTDTSARSGNTADLDYSNNSTKEELSEIHYQSEIARHLLLQQAQEEAAPDSCAGNNGYEHNEGSDLSEGLASDYGYGPATLSVSTGSLEETSHGKQEVKKEEYYNSSYFDDYMESFITNYNEEDQQVNEHESTGSDHSAYYSTSGAILVMVGSQEDVSTLGGESRVLVLGDEGEDVGPPIAELRISRLSSDDNIGFGTTRRMSSSDYYEGSIASECSEVTYGSCETEEASDDWSLSVKPSPGGGKTQDIIISTPRSNKQEQQDMNLPLIAMTKQLERSKDDLTRILQDLLMPATSDEDEVSSNLNSSANSLLAECDALLMQLVTLSFKKNTAMIAKLKMCQEITLRECEDLLMQLNQVKVDVARHWLAFASSSSRSISRGSEEGCIKSVICIQAFIRSGLQRRRYKRVLSSVKLLQSFERGWLVRKNLPSSMTTKSFPKKDAHAVGLDRLSSLDKKGEKKYLTLHEEKMNKLRAEYFRLSQKSNTLQKNSPEYIAAKQEMELIAKCIIDLHHQELLSNRKKKKCLAQRTKKRPTKKGKIKAQRRRYHTELEKEYLDLYESLEDCAIR